MAVVASKKTQSVSRFLQQNQVSNLYPKVEDLLSLAMQQRLDCLPNYFA
ncbi:hypothetical protein QDY71_10485 [Kingella negevensis]|uniref:Uncharacterized protein n=1 Tax=Kingella negevensis TaxID=1522312 RepID=A0A238TAT0_9NEIS|nr:hypothetical protein [Kingella negevensis]MDK4680790.1 hypothetical protein [Kingella negevensis]MDK4681487.1 hypothetical protein [Kingella negevensis]MDK4684229.1 hypothetical protein [Kingella negevensis]MDK4691874.1 hypothetical protein [Kingella negevensis]MDK4692973.1 hypothetical protein [Kingella negevensis]